MRASRKVGSCPMCERGALWLRKVPYSDDDLDYGNFEAEVCDRCGETFLTEESARAIETKEKEMGTWGLERRSRVSYSGSSLMVRIPKELERFLKITKGEEVLIRPRGRRRIEIELVQ